MSVMEIIDKFINLITRISSACIGSHGGRDGTYLISRYAPGQVMFVPNSQNPNNYFLFKIEGDSIKYINVDEYVINPNNWLECDNTGDDDRIVITQEIRISNSSPAA